MDDLISRQAVDKIINGLLENDNLQASPSVWHGLHMIKQLPSAQVNTPTDTISRQAAIDTFYKYPNIDWTTLDVLEKINALPSAQPEQRWIPCSERLPKAGEYEGNVEKYYLVQNEYGDMLVARYTHSEYWEQIYQLKPCADEIVAWMPLPEPYKAESVDKE